MSRRSRKTSWLVPLGFEWLEDRRLLAITVTPVSNQATFEGQLVDLTGTFGAPVLSSFMDSNTLQTHTGTVNWGDGNSVQNTTVTESGGSGTLSGAHTYADDGTYTVTVSVIGKNGGSASQSFNVLVKNVPPVLVPAADQTVNEGQLLNLTNSGNAPALALFVDQGFDNLQNPNGPVLPNIADPLHESFTYDVDWGDGIGTINGAPVADINGGPGVSSSGAIAGSHTYADNGTYNVTITVHDDNGGVTSRQFAVTVKNVSPTLGISGASDVNEDSLYTLNLSSSDPGIDTISKWTINWGNGTQVVAGNPLSVVHTYADGDANYTVTATATDEDGTYPAGNSVSVIVRNVAPSLAINAAANVGEGATYTLNLSSSDPGFDTISKWTINWGDGIQVVAGNPSSVVHTYADGPAVYTISATATDEDGTFAAGNTVSVTVQNAAPTLVISGAASVNEGSSYTLNLSSSDPGPDTISKWTINWGDSVQVVAGNPSSVTHTYAKGNAGYTISATATDEDGTFPSNTVDVAVKNVAPTIALTPISDINENDTVTLIGAYTDVGRADGQTLVINWGDANYTASSLFAIPAIQNSVGGTLLVTGAIASSTDGAQLTIDAINAAAGIVTFHIAHLYVDDGASATGNNTVSDSVTVIATTTDDGGLSGTASRTFNVNNVAPVAALNAVSAINENGFATLTGSYTDIGLSDVHKLTVNWGDPNNGANSIFNIPATRTLSGTPAYNSTGTDTTTTLTITSFNATTGLVTFSVQHQYLDDGLALGNSTVSDVSTVSVTVADDDTQSGNQSKTVVVTNTAPTVTLNAVPNIVANGTATLTGAFADSGLLDAHTAVINWGDPNNSTNSSFSVGAIRSSTGVLTLHVSDTIASSTDTALLTVTSIVLASGQVGFSVQHRYVGAVATNVTRTIGVTVADDDAQNASASTTAVIVVPPLLTGDYNLNRVVDAADYLLYRKTQGGHVANYSGADGNGDGQVEQQDYTVWRSHFGESLPSGGAGTALESPTLGGHTNFYASRQSEFTGSSASVAILGESTSGDAPTSALSPEASVMQMHLFAFACDRRSSPWRTPLTTNTIKHQSSIGAEQLSNALISSLASPFRRRIVDVDFTPHLEPQGSDNSENIACLAVDDAFEDLERQPLSISGASLVNEGGWVD